MKKFTLKALLVAATLGMGGNAWADPTSIYERGTTNAWADGDLTDWSCDYATPTISGGLSVNSTNAGWACTKSLTTTENSIVTLNATLKTGGASGRSGSYDYVAIGGVTIGFNDQDKQAFVKVGDTSTNLTLTYERASAYNIQVVINQATGAVTYQVGTATGTTNTATAVTNVIFGHSKAGKENYGITTVLQKIDISEEAQTVTTTNYTINYKFNGSVIKTVNGTSAVDAVINAENPITIEGSRYYVSDGATSSMTLVAGENTLNVELRAANTESVNINAIDEDGTILKTFSATRTEGDDASNVFYTRAVKYNGKYYTIPAANANGVNYGRSMAYGAADINITYTLDESISYYAEAEDLTQSRSYAAEGNVPERASGGHWYRPYAGAKYWTTSLDPGIYTFDVSGRNQGGSAATLAIKVRLNDGTFIDTEHTLSLGNSENSVKTFTNIEVPTNASIALVNTDDSNNSNIAIDYVIVYRTGYLTATATIGTTGYTSFASSYALDLDQIDGATAYYASSVTDGSVNLLQATGTVAAGTGLILKGTAGGAVTIPAVTTGETISGNLLVGCPTETTINSETAGYANFYVLSATVAEFQNLAEYIDGGNTVTIPAGKAYLNAATSGSAKLRVIFEGEDATAITAVEAVKAANDGIIYNLRGQRVAQPTKGIYIQNGKKILVK